MQRLEHIWARREARIAAGLPPDAMDPKVNLVEEEEDWEDARQDEEEEAETEAGHAMTIDDMLTYMDEEEEPKPSTAPIYSAPHTDDVNISNHEA
ncbi:hypothetical protein D1007_38005 [Hordeum vulgare]|nr:hypothetical protein D1007_38005 [Hordeum vulgare]